MKQSLLHISAHKTPQEFSETLSLPASRLPNVGTLGSRLTAVAAYSCPGSRRRRRRGAADADPRSDEVPWTGSLREGVGRAAGADGPPQDGPQVCWLLGNAVNLHHTQTHIGDPASSNANAKSKSCPAVHKHFHG